MSIAVFIFIPLESLDSKYLYKLRDKFFIIISLRSFSADESKVFDRELTSIVATIKKKQILVDRDQLPQPSIQTEDLRQLPALIEDGEVLTSGNTSVSSV